MTHQVDPDFRLTPEQRANVRRGFDLDALERLVSMAPPAEDEHSPSVFSGVRPGKSASVVVETGDPQLKQLLDEVYAAECESVSADESLAFANPVKRIGSELPLNRPF